MNIGLIGYGRFGKLAARHLSRRATVFVYESRGSPRRSAGKIIHSPLARAASQPVVILAVPVSALRRVLRDIRPYLVPSALVIDVCAVKLLPARWMKKALPPDTRIIGAHPLFGPDSAAKGVRGQTAVLCRIRCPLSTFRALRSLLRKEGIAVLEMSPDDHDRLAAETVFLTQFIGRTVQDLRLRRRPLATRSYRELMGLVDVARHDSLQLFRDMFTYNKHARRLHASIVRALRGVERDLR